MLFAFLDKLPTPVQFLWRERGYYTNTSGFTLGQMVRVVRFAPLGDPMQIRIRGFNLALRRNEARRIVLDPL